MIKINWGTKITILYIGFVFLIGTMVVLCLNQKIDVVSNDYYQKELVFQNRIDETLKANALDEKITHTITNTNLALEFPTIFKGEKVTGEIVFFRPSDASKDLTIAIELNEQEQQLIPINKLSKGMYKMQIGWKARETAYYKEETIVIP